MEFPIMSLNGLFKSSPIERIKKPALRIPNRSLEEIRAEMKALQALQERRNLTAEDMQVLESLYRELQSVIARRSKR